MTERTFSARLGCRYLLHVPENTDARTVLVAALHGFRSEERRVGKEGRSRRAWSSAVCSSDLYDGTHLFGAAGLPLPAACAGEYGRADRAGGRAPRLQIGRASCRERG